MIYESAPASFNEAGAVMPRKARLEGAGALVVVDASMRPGLLCPGKRRVAWQGEGVVLGLQ